MKLSLGGRSLYSLHLLAKPLPMCETLFSLRSLYSYLEDPLAFPTLSHLQVLTSKMFSRYFQMYSNGQIIPYLQHLDCYVKNRAYIMRQDILENLILESNLTIKGVNKIDPYVEKQKTVPNEMLTAHKPESSGSVNIIWHRCHGMYEI